MPRIALFLFVFFFFITSCAANNFKKVCIQGICIKAEVADSPESRQRGLMFRQNLGQDEGMFFIFEKEDIHVFWMKNMNFPIDIIWIDAKKRVVDIRENVPPCSGSCPSIMPSQRARYVLELSAGFVEKNGIKTGDTLKFQTRIGMGSGG